MRTPRSLIKKTRHAAHAASPRARVWASMAIHEMSNVSEFRAGRLLARARVGSVTWYRRAFSLESLNCLEKEDGK